MRKTIITAMGLASLLAIRNADAMDHVTRTENFKPFSIVSMDGSRKMPSSAIAKIMCKAMDDQTIYDLTHKFDIVETHSEGGLHDVVYPGEQNGHPVKVSFFLFEDQGVRKIQVVYVNGDVAMRCEF